MPLVAILDDYVGLALDLADWSSVQAQAEITVFDRHLSEAEAADALRPFDVVCTMRERMALPRTLIERLPNLKLIAWGLMIATVRNLAEEHRRMRDGGWQTTTGMTLCGKTLGLLGLGRIGKRMADYANVFGMEVIAWSQNLTEEAAAAAGARWVGKATLFEESDVVSVHLVLSERTRGLVAEPELSLMKPHAYLINTSRGPIVDEAALISALRARRIAGAGLDVYDVEPLPPDHPLRLLPNVTLSPHLGYVTREMLTAFYSDTVEAVVAWLNGTPVRIANAEASQRGTSQG
jgi:phosphoglycerate dehydrogenase-like enzyme